MMGAETVGSGRDFSPWVAGNPTWHDDIARNEDLSRALDAADVRLIRIRVHIRHRGMTRPVNTRFISFRPRGGTPPRHAHGERPLTHRKNAVKG